MIIRFIRAAVLMATFLVMVTGCSKSYRVVLKGGAQAPRPMGCKVVFEEVDPDKATMVYLQIGIISVDGLEDGELSEGMKEEISERACKMGGEIIVPMGSDQGVEETTTSFLVLIARDEGIE